MLNAVSCLDNSEEFWVEVMGSQPADDDPVFATSAGKRLGSVKKSLSELLRAAGLLTDHRSAPLTFSGTSTSASSWPLAWMCSCWPRTPARAAT
jgi:hypothetical protein